MNGAHRTIQPSDIHLAQCEASLEDRAFVGAKFCFKCCTVVLREERVGASSSNADPARQAQDYQFPVIQSHRLMILWTLTSSHLEVLKVLMIQWNSRNCLTRESCQLSPNA